MNFKVLRIDTRLVLPETRWWLVAGIVSGLASLLTAVALFWAIGIVIDGIAQGTDPLAAWWPWLLGLLLARGLLTWAGREAQFRASSRTKIAIRDRMYQQALRLGPAFLDRKRTGAVVSTATNGMEWIEQFYGVYIVQFAVAILTPLVLCISLLFVNWIAALAMLVTVPMMPMFLAIMAAGFRKDSRRSAEANSRLSAQFLDALQGMTTLKSFGLGRQRGEQIEQESEAQRKASMRLLFTNQRMVLWTDLAFGLGITVVMSLVVFGQLAAGVMSPGTAIALLLISTEFWKPLAFIGSFFFAGGVGREIANRITAFLDETPPVQDAPGATTPPALARPHLAVENLTFSYPGTDRPAVDGVSFSLAPGEMVALVGPSGSGKTTVTSLLMRFLQPAAGTVLLDDHDSTGVTADWIRHHLALVPQDPYLFYGTIAQNLRVARTDATDDDLREACQAADLLRFIETLPLGFDTLVGERGLSLSGGQAQRLAIARALLKGAPIVILDEPTSQIDPETEAVVQEALALLRGRCSLLVVAHRLHTAERADRIVVMDRGRVIESGPPDVLAASGGMWSRMVGLAQWSDTPPARQEQEVMP